MNANRQGYNNQKRTEKVLNDYGVIDTAARPSRFGGKHDHFKLFDHIFVCTNPLMLEYVEKDKIKTYVFMPEQIYFIQTKSRIQSPKETEKYRLFPAKNILIFAWIKQENGRYLLTIQEVK
jgi:hypothetical protein